MELLTYKTLYDRDEVDALAKTLHENEIEFELEEDRESLDALYGDKPLGHVYFVKLKSTDFVKANSILEAVDENDIINIRKDHYLFGFTDEELFDLLSKPDEWNALDYALAKKILRERGKEVNDHVIDLLKNRRIVELAKPEESSKAWIYAGYFFAFTGGLIGFLIAISLVTSRKNLPDGRRVYVYSAGDRKHGFLILSISITMITTLAILRFRDEFW